MREVPIKREIRPAAYRIDVQQSPQGPVLLVHHPLDGDGYVYVLDDDTRQRLVRELSAGHIQPATLAQMPADPRAWEGSD